MANACGGAEIFMENGNGMVGGERLECETSRARSHTKELIASVKAGDQGSFRELLELYDPLMLSLVGHYHGLVSPEDIEDMRIEALVGLHKAALGYDAEQDGVEFGLYAKICIKNHLATVYRSYLRRNKLKIVRLDPYDDESEDSETLLAVEDDPMRRAIERESLEILQKRISDTLSDYENRVWWMYMSGMSAKEIASALASAPQSRGSKVPPTPEKAERSVENALYRIRKKLRAALSDEV